MWGKPFGHSNPLFYSMNLLKAADIVELKTGLFMFKARNNELHKTLQILFNLRDQLICFATHQQYKFIHRYSCTNSKYVCKSVKEVNLWNSVDHILINCGNITLFKTRYTANLLEHYKFNNDNVY